MVVCVSVCLWVCVCARARSAFVRVTGTTESIFIGLWKGDGFTPRDALLSVLFKALQSMKLPLRLCVQSFPEQ